MKKKATYNNNIYNKFRSRRGASITLALFLFLICAVIGSAALTAGTAAAGRRAQIERSDSRYYAVSSAAQLFRDVITGESVELERVKEIKTEYEYTLVEDDTGNSARQESEPRENSSVTEYRIGLANSVNSFADDLNGAEGASILVGVVGELIDPSAPSIAFDAKIEKYTSGEGYEYTLSHNGTPADIPSPEKLDVKVTMQIQKNGDLVFTFSSADIGDSTDDIYILRETFRLKVDETEDETVEEETPQIIGTASPYREVYSVTATYTKLATFTWEFANLEVIGGTAR